MTCFIAQNLLTELVDDALEPARASELRAHLGGCPGCTRELEDLRRVRSMLRGLPVEAAPPDFLAAVRAKAERRGVFERVSDLLGQALRLPPMAQGGLALAASLVVVVTVYFNNESRDESVWNYASAPGSNVDSRSGSDSLVQGGEGVPARGAESMSMEDGDGRPSEEQAVATDGEASLAGPETPIGGATVAERRDSAAAGKAASPAKSKIAAAREVPVMAPKKAESRAVTNSAPAPKSAAATRDAVSGDPVGNIGSPMSTRERTAPATPPPSLADSTQAAGAGSAGRSASGQESGGAADPAFGWSASEPEPAFDVDSERIAAAKKGRRQEDRRTETETPSPAGAKSPARASFEDTMSAPSDGADESELAEADDVWAEDGGSMESLPVAAPPRSASAPAAAEKTISVARKPPPQIGAVFAASVGDAPKRLAEAAKAVGGRLVSPSGAPPALARSGASTVVIVEIPANAIDAFRRRVEEAGSLDLHAEPPGSTVRLRIEVVRE